MDVLEVWEMDIHVYTFRDTDDREVSYYTQDFNEAYEFAQANHLLMMDNTFKWYDSELVEDFIEYDEEDGEDN